MAIAEISSWVGESTHRQECRRKGALSSGSEADVLQEWGEAFPERPGNLWWDSLWKHALQLLRCSKRPADQGFCQDRELH